MKYEPTQGLKGVLDLANAMPEDVCMPDGMTILDYLILSRLHFCRTVGELEDHLNDDRRDVVTLTKCVAAGVVLVDTELTLGKYDDGGHIKRTYYIAPDGNWWWLVPGNCTVEDLFAVGLVQSESRCQHSYDCCGHTYYRAPSFTLNCQDSTLVVEQSWYINI